MEPLQRVAASPQLPADVDVSHSFRGISTHLPVFQSTSSSSSSSSQEQDQHQEQEQPNLGLQQLAFQDSNLSPALFLVPENSRPENNFTENSLFQQSDAEFASLRAYPDVSMASERFHTTRASEYEPLSQHPLTQTTIHTEEGVDSCGSLSQHSLSSGDQDRQDEEVHTSGLSSTGQTGTKTETFPDLALQVARDETFFLSKDVSAQRLMDLLQKDVGLQSSTSSTVSSASETSVKSTPSYQSAKFSKSMGKRERPSGEASFPQQVAQQPAGVLNSGQSEARPSEVCNITMGARSPRPDESSEALRRALVSEAEARSSCEAESEKKQPETQTPSFPSTTAEAKERTEGKPSGVRTKVGGVPYTGPFSAGIQRFQREQQLWSSGNQPGIDGSYLGFLPQSQSTPGVFKVPPKSSVTPKLSAVESSKDNSYETSSGVSQQPAAPITQPDHSNTAAQHQKDSTSTEVQSLPSLSYLQKVDAWRANQSSGKTSLFDSLALQGFSGISPKKKAYDAVSDSLNRILTQQARTLQQPLVSSAANQSVPQSSSSAPCGSPASRRGEAVGSAPSEKDKMGSAAPPSVSPCGRSLSHSSLNTVVMSVNKEPQTERPPEGEESDSEDDSPLPPPPPHHVSSTVQPSPLMSLGHFSDVSLDPDLTLSSSQESYSGVKTQTSIGASSVVSLEIDNYAPYWTSKLSTPPVHRPPELNIDERIPLYLRNLGIDQSPSTILTPFAPRGPIREPEFSPTDLCKGSTATPAQSTQASDGGSPQKGESPRSSVHSVDSSESALFSLDSLGPAASAPQRVRWPSPPSETEARLADRRLVSCPDEDTHLPPPRPSQPQWSSSLTSSQTNNQLPAGQTDSESLLQMSSLTDKVTEDSFVSSRVFVEIRELLSHADSVMLTGSSASSSAPPTARRLLLDEEPSTSQNKRSVRLQDSLLSPSFTAGHPRTPSSQLWTSSSSDSMLTSDTQRQRSVGQENTTSSRQPDYPLAQAASSTPAAAPYTTSQDHDVSSGATTSLILPKSARRTEPEGCSAAPSTNAPNQPPAIKPPSAVGAQQRTSSPADTAGLAEEEEEEEEEVEEEERTSGGPAQSTSSFTSSSSSPVMEDTDQDGSSNGSSQSSLTVRVAKLLQNESPAAMVSSTPSTTDQEEGRARDWMKLKVSGLQGERRELNREDRKRIEEIKRELLLKNPIKSQGSTDTDSSAASSFKVPQQLDAPHPATLSDASSQLPGATPGHATTQPTHSFPPDLEAQVCEIAAREGVILPSKKPRALTSITIATSRRSPSPSPSTSPAPPHSPAPEPLHLTELSTGAHTDEEENVSSSLHEPNDSFRRISPSWTAGNERRQDTMGGQYEEPPPPPPPPPPSPPPPPPPPPPSHQSRTRTGHVSHVHLTLSPKSPGHTPAPADPSRHPNTASRPPRKDFVPLRVTSAASSPDEGVGSTSPPEWLEVREPASRRAPAPSDASATFKPARPQGSMADTSTQFFSARRRAETSPRRLDAETQVPVLLPYKPPGSEEFFYVPQTEADVSDTTMESSHTGSDDAVPPRFSSEVLGHQDPGVDRGITLRHTEGIYSKRLKTATFKMQRAKHTDGSEDSDKSSSSPSESGSKKPPTSAQASVAATGLAPPSTTEALRRDQGTSPIQFPRDDRPEPARDGFEPLREVQTTPAPRGRQVQAGGSDPHQTASQQNSLDQLWRRFCREWTEGVLQPPGDREASLLERLERLDRLIHGRRSGNMGEEREEVQEGGYQTKPGRRREELRRREKKEEFQEMRRSSELRQREQKVQRDEEYSRTSSSPSSSSFSSSGFSHSSAHSQLLSPAARSESDNLSTTSASLSTVDTARLVRVFGAHKVQQLKTRSGLGKLYGAIDKQREERGAKREELRGPPHAVTPSDQSTVADSWSASTFTVPSRRGATRTLGAKRAGRLVNKGIQAGDLEIVSNGTRKHTRDVGTTFPSPGLSSAHRGAGEHRSAPKGHAVQKQRKSKRSSSKPYPAGVSWFISANNLSSAARKENRPEEEEQEEAPTVAWFEPYSRVRPWRQPLRQRHVQEDRHGEPSFTRHPEVDLDPRDKAKSSGPARVSLQAALETRCPKFISRSRQRVERLMMQVEDRKLQVFLSGERDYLRGPERVPRPAGTVHLRRAVPRREMIQRSKQIYESLPEVQRKREEERRRAEYCSYRLNAQLYNKRITNQVLGRRSAWQ